MNQHVPQIALGQLAFAAIAATMAEKPAIGGLPDIAHETIATAAQAARLAPSPEDRALVRLADGLGFTMVELMTLAVLAGIETDPEACRMIAIAQAPLGGARPLVGLLATAFAMFGPRPKLMRELAMGGAELCGCFILGNEDAPLPERSLALAQPVLQALCGIDRPPQGAALLRDDGHALAPAREAQARDWRKLLTAAQGRGLVIRAVNLAEAKAAASQFAADMKMKPVWIAGEAPAGLAPWLIASGALPIFGADPRPGERRVIPDLAPYRGPWLCAAGRDGIVEAVSGPPLNWTICTGAAAERETLWRKGGAMDGAARRAAQAYRLGPARIAGLASAASALARAQGRDAIEWPDIENAAAAQPDSNLTGLAERLPGRVGDEAFVMQPHLREELGNLLGRCRLREELSRGLGPAAQARYRPGVRALFHGASGTGKSLAAHWLATALGLPLYRADLASLTSKWIGETEKNIGQLLSAAEEADVVLLFDEADSLFAARTEVGSANDKYANGQTNYLLQRLESHEGVVILTSNARERLDSAFTRRLDVILEFPLPDMEARRGIWRAHLADQALSETDLNRIAAAVDLAGGHIRNVAFGAAVLAGGEPPSIDHLIAAARAEYVKLGRGPPRELG